MKKNHEGGGENAPALSFESIETIHFKLKGAALKVNRKAQTAGRVSNLGASTFGDLPTDLKQATRALVDDAYPNYSSTKRRHPIAQAIEGGLTVGTLFARTTLPLHQLGIYYASLTEELNFLHTHYKLMPFDLDDIMRLQGRSTLLGLGLPSDSVLFRYIEPLPNSDTEAAETNKMVEDLNIIYGDALGASIATLERILVVDEMQQATPRLRRLGHRSINSALHTLSWASAEDIVAAINQLPN